jgi:8-hydroxy-5-deazaflavin:NADPH oxidoreductase
MNIAILGGTGKEGSGLAARWARAGYTIVIGSRDAERAKTKANELRTITGASAISGVSNADAAAHGEIVVIALPADGLGATLPPLASQCAGKVVVSTVVSLTFGGGRLYTPPAAGSSAEEAQALLPGARVVAAFHHIAAHELSDAAHPIDCDLLMCGGDADAKKAVSDLGASLGLRAIDVGALTNAGPLEGITAVLATINRRYKLKNAGIRITGV